MHARIKRYLRQLCSVRRCRLLKLVAFVICVGVSWSLAVNYLYLWSKSNTINDLRLSIIRRVFNFSSESIHNNQKNVSLKTMNLHEDFKKISIPWNGNTSGSANTKLGDVLQNSKAKSFNQLKKLNPFNRSVCLENGRLNQTLVEALYKKHCLNVCLSDMIPLDRAVPDSRPFECQKLTYPDKLLSASVIVTFHEEWPSVLLRTIHSIINRTPAKWLHEIILVDDASTMEVLKDDLDAYLERFPRGLVRMVRLHKRQGLVQARLAGIANARGDVIVIFDSHMEVNHYWLEPLLAEIKKDRKIFAMATLDYINLNSFDYKFSREAPRYPFEWRLTFYEDGFRPDPPGKKLLLKPGIVMVGSGFAVDREYFYEIGGYDTEMKIWGGENLELSWRVWMCGGRLIHVLCSQIGHIGRGQPYSFPGGRHEISMYNYKRAVEVWMEPKHKELVYSHFPGIEDVDAGDLSDRLKLKSKLKCKSFSWYLRNRMPELGVLNENTTAWGRARNTHTNLCLDNSGYVHCYHYQLKIAECRPFNTIQGFSITKTRLLQAPLHCVKLLELSENVHPSLEDCLSGREEKWKHSKNGFLLHELSGLCLDIQEGEPTMKKCNKSSPTQKWTFDHYV